MASIPDSLQELSSGLRRDLSCALQQMRRSPTFTAVVVLTLLASASFDPQLIWENTSLEHDPQTST